MSARFRSRGSQKCKKPCLRLGIILQSQKPLSLRVADCRNPICTLAKTSGRIDPDRPFSIRPAGKLRSRLLDPVAKRFGSTRGAACLSLGLSVGADKKMGIEVREVAHAPGSYRPGRRHRKFGLFLFERRLCAARTGSMHSFRALFFVVLFSPVMASAASGFEIRDFKAEEAQIHTREFKKVEVSAIIEIAPGMPEPALNLVQVTEQGQRLRFLGILLYNPKKGRWSRKVELLEREPGRLYFEIVPEGELEPFQKLPRQRAVIEVFKRPSLIEILRGVWDRFTAGFGKRIPAASAVALAGEPPFPCGLMPGVRPEGWKPVPASEGMPEGTLGLAAVRKLDDAEKGSVAGLRTTIDQPAARVLELLWDPQHHKNPGNSRITVEPQRDGAKLVSVEASPVFFLSLIHI